MMTTQPYPLSRQNDIVIQQLKKEFLIYDLKAHKAYCLNETSAMIWQSCDGNRSIAQIAQIMSNNLKMTVTEDLVWLAVDQLKKDNLLANGDKIAVKFEGLSRREAIRHIGLVSVVTLPVVSSLLAPTAAHAQSGRVGVGQPCTGETGTQGNCDAGLICCEICVDEEAGPFGTCGGTG